MIYHFIYRMVLIYVLCCKIDQLNYIYTSDMQLVTGNNGADNVIKNQQNVGR